MHRNHSKNQNIATMDESEVINKVSAYKMLLKDHFTIEKMYLFGSYANGTAHDDSDIDVAIVVDHIEGDFFFE
jgi:predicted nucleotidyltransferase